MGTKMRACITLACIMTLLLLLPICSASSDTDFMMELSKNTWSYLKSDWATDNHLPWSWRSSYDSGGSYANPAEIGFYMLSWIGAYEMGQNWSPSWNDVESEVSSTLTRLEIWQNGSQNDGYGPHSFNNSVFYQWYWVSWNPPRVGTGTTDHGVSSVDNAWLAASLITVEQYAKEHNRTVLQTEAHNILKDMDFSIWYHPDTHMFSWGGSNDPQGGGLCNYYSNENRITNFIARALGSLNESEFKVSLNALTKNSASYNGITVENVNWDGSYFTYTSPGIFINESPTSYGKNTTDKATLAQITYASDSGYPVWGISDCYDVLLGGYLARGAPPRGSGSSSTDPDTGIITPHASALALSTSYSQQASQNLLKIKQLYPQVYNSTYGFLDSVNLNTNQTSYRYVALDQEWAFLSLMNYFNGTIWKYFYKNENVSRTHNEMFNITNQSGQTNQTNQTYPSNYITVCKSGACNYTTIQNAVSNAKWDKVVFVTDGGIYNESVSYDCWGSNHPGMLDCNGATIMGNNTLNSIGVNTCNSYNTSVKNCIIMNFYYGINAWDSYYQSYINNTACNNSIGFYIRDTDRSTVVGNNASYNGIYGINIYWIGGNHIIKNNVVDNNGYVGIFLNSGIYNTSIENNSVRNNNVGISTTNMYGNNDHDNSFFGNIITNNNHGIEISDSGNNTVYNNIISQNSYGLHFWWATYMNSIYNNIFNNTANIFSPPEVPNIWNVTIKLSRNIVGGSRFGGNYWAYPNGTGFSETCADADNNSICDSVFSINTNNTDFLPLAVPKPSGLTGDVDNNCIVDLFDLAGVGICFGRSPSGSCAGADLNKDGLVNILDLATVGINFGRHC